MLRWIMTVRRRSRLLAVALVVLTFIGTGGAWHATDDDDFAEFVAHDHSSHHEHLRLPSARTASDHCALCHWLQAFRADGTRSARAHVIAASPRERAFTVAKQVRTVFRLDLPSRAPPA
jgi:hypothetical protein